MDANRFDALTRNVASRRQALAAALGGIPLLGLIDAAAKKRRHRKQCRNKLIHVSCVDNCRTWHTSNCKSRWKRCTCSSGTTCLLNEGCGISCDASPCPEGSGCTCSTSDPKVCLAPFTTCDDMPIPCETIADCRYGFTCDDTPCGEGAATEKRCVPLCRA